MTSPVDPLQQAFEEALSKFIGEKPDPKTIEAEVKKAIEEMAAKRGHCISVDDVTMSEDGSKVTASIKLPVPSPIHETIILEPQVDPPYAPWRNSDGVTHWSGWSRAFDGDKRLVLLCTFMHVDLMYCEPAGAVITCLECIRWESERMLP